jgi:hypothetical protein
MSVIEEQRDSFPRSTRNLATRRQCVLKTKMEDSRRMWELQSIKLWNKQEITRKFVYKERKHTLIQRNVIIQ